MTDTQWSAPRPGRYEFTENDTSDGSEYVRVVRVETRSDKDAIHVTFHSSVGSETHQAVEEREWRSGGVYWLSQALPAFRPGASDFSCEWDPPLLEVPRRADLGDAWSNDSLCDGGGGGTREVRHSRIVGDQEVDTVLGPVRALVIATEVRDSSSVGTDSSTIKSWYAPSLGMRVRFEEHYDSRYGGKFTVTGVLKSFSPTS